MADIMTPALGESVTEATVARWTKKAGDAVKRDEVVVELDTDKVSLEVVAPEDGVITSIDAAEGSTVEPGQRLGQVGTGAPVAKAAAPEAKPAPKPEPKPEPAASPPAAASPATSQRAPAAVLPPAPSVQRLAEENRLDLNSVAGSGKDGRITKGDALAAIDALARRPTPAPEPAPARPVDAREERVRMSRLRQTIARRLKEAQANAAMLTTFNEVDMSNVMAIRNRYKEAFEKR